MVQPSKLSGPQSTTPRKRSAGRLLADTFGGWQADNVGMYGAALAYYAVFSIVPLLVVSLALAGALFGQQAAEGALRHQLEAFIAPEGAAEIEDLVARAHRPEKSLLAGVSGTAVLLLAASGFFSQLQAALNAIWKTQASAGGVIAVVRERFWSFAAVFLAGAVLLLDVALSTAADAAGQWSGNFVPQLVIVWRSVDGLISWGVGAAVFALVFKMLPLARVAWHDVWIGAGVTAVLFAAGKFLFGLYLRWVSFDTMYGPAGALILVLVWAYYSAQIVLLGAEFTHAYSLLYGSRAPVDLAERPAARLGHKARPGPG